MSASSPVGLSTSSLALSSDTTMLSTAAPTDSFPHRVSQNNSSSQLSLPTVPIGAQDPTRLRNVQILERAQSSYPMVIDGKLTFFCTEEEESSSDESMSLDGTFQTKTGSSQKQLPTREEVLTPDAEVLGSKFKEKSPLLAAMDKIGPPSPMDPLDSDVD